MGVSEYPVVFKKEGSKVKFCIKKKSCQGGSSDETRHKVWSLIWWSVPGNNTWSDSLDQVTFMMIYLLWFKSKENKTVFV